MGFSYSSSALLQITAKTKGLEAVASLQQGIDALSRSAQRAEKSIKGASEETNRWGDGAKTAAMSAAIIAATKASIDFETSMSQVRKVVDGLESPKAFKEIQQEILDLSSVIPVSIEGITEIYAAAGQSGIAKQNIRQFAILVAEVGSAFDMTAKDAATALSQLSSSLGMTTPEVRELADAINYLDNKTGASAANLVEFMTRSGAMGRLAGMSAEQTSAFGAAMIQAGTDTEVAATSFNNMIRALSRGPSMTERQVDALRRLGYEMVNAADVERELTRQAEQASAERLRIAERSGEELVRAARAAGDLRIRVAEQEADGLIREARRASEERIRIAEAEEERLNKAVSRKFRAERTQLRRNAEDQARLIEKNYKDRENEQIKSLRRQEEAELEAARQRASMGGYSANEELRAIQESYDRAYEQIRGGTERALLEERRSAEDRQVLLEDQIQDREEAERKASEDRLEALREEEENKLMILKEGTDKKLIAIKAEEEEKLRIVEDGVRRRYEAIKEVESRFLEEAKASAKKTGEELAAASAQGFADRLQKDAQGTVLEVLSKINQLPKSQQVSVISDLFGDEARGLPSLINNLDELQRILELVGDKGQYAGSVSQEAGIRFGTAGSQVQLFWNNLTKLNKAFGDVFKPILEDTLKLLNPLIEGLTKLVQFFGEMATRVLRNTIVIGGLSFAVGSLVGPLLTATAVIGGFMSLVTINRWLSGIAILAQIPGPLRLIGVALAAIGLASTPLGNVITALSTMLFIFQGIKLVLGGVGLVQPFITALTGLAAWIGSTFVPTLLAFFSGPAGWTVLAVAAVVTMVALFREPIWNFLIWLGEQFAKIPETLAGMGEALKNTLLGVLTWLQENTAGFFQGFLEGMNTMLTAVGDALRAGITLAWDWIKKRAEDLQKFFTKIPENIGKAFKTAFDVAVKAIRGAINAVIQAAGNAVNAFIQSVNNMIARINSMSARVGISLVYVPQVQIPQFAYGAYVTKSTVAEFGERRPEYAIPDDMMARASLNYLQGARGGAVLNSTPRTAASGGGSVSVSVKTGDVIQMPGMAEPMMLVSDGAAMVRAAVAQTLNLLNSSEGRIAGAF